MSGDRRLPGRAGHLVTAPAAQGPRSPFGPQWQERPLRLLPIDCLQLRTLHLLKWHIGLGKGGQGVVPPTAKGQVLVTNFSSITMLVITGTLSGLSARTVHPTCHTSILSRSREGTHDTALGQMASLATTAG